MADKAFLKEKAEELIAAPMCYSALRMKAQAWLDSIGEANEGYTIEAFVQELERDVNSIDNLIELVESPKGEEIFGAEVAKAMAEQAHAAKESGTRYCICAACTAGGAILDNRNAFEL